MIDFSAETVTDLHIQLLYNGKAVFVFLVGIAFSFRWWKKLSSIKAVRRLNEKSVNKAAFAAKYTAIVLIFVLSLSCLMSNSYNPFIYFRF